ncbi:MAG: alpha-galactosidase [Kiritimatiellae bacterium]|nr:alpha-galactosidase [Kiritimatiellia bacterium]
MKQKMAGGRLEIRRVSRDMCLRQIVCSVALAGAVMAAGATRGEAVPLCETGDWRLSFDADTSSLRLENAKMDISLDGPLSYRARGCEWKVVPSRDPVASRLALVDTQYRWGYNNEGVVHAFVSFRGTGGRLEMRVFRRGVTGGYEPGTLSYAPRVKVRKDSFPCRTIPADDEGIISFADGAGDTALNDSIFARGEDLALRFFARGTCIRTVGDGLYDVRLDASTATAAQADIAIEADGSYFASRWLPGYHPIDRRRCPRAPTGWMSWNTYFDKAGAKENLAEARVAAKYLRPFGLEFFSIESWQNGTEWLPTSTAQMLDLSREERQFPYPMKQLADELRALGFRPGIWNGFLGCGDGKFRREHADWFIYDEKGKPVPCWNGEYMLDTSRPEVIEFLRNQAHIISREWGFDFFKFDGLANTPLKFESPTVRAMAKNPSDRLWFENAVRAFREGVGEDKVILGCMGFITATEARFLDATRTGGDVVGVYRGLGETYAYGGDVSRPSDVCQFPVRWSNVLSQLRATLAQVFVNNITAYTDPDTLLVNYALEDGEAHTMATIIGLPGQLMFAGDKLGTLRMDRMRIIQQLLPVADIHPQNLYPYSGNFLTPVWNLSVTRPFGRWNVVALFNFNDGPQDMSVDIASLGLDASKEYVAYEFWRQTYTDSVKGRLDAGSVPMRSVKLYALREKTACPQLVGDDRHLTQGAVELEDARWDEPSMTYSMSVRAVADFPFAYMVRCPEGLTFMEAKAEGGKVKVNRRKDGLLAATVSSGESRSVGVKLSFKRKP